MSPELKSVEMFASSWSFGSFTPPGPFPHARGRGLVLDPSRHPLSHLCLPFLALGSQTVSSFWAIV